MNRAPDPAWLQPHAAEEDVAARGGARVGISRPHESDRKSTRLNSSH